MIPYSADSKANAKVGTKSTAPSIKRVKIGIGIRAMIKKMKGIHSETCEVIT